MAPFLWAPASKAMAARTGRGQLNPVARWALRAIHQENDQGK